MRDIKFRCYRKKMIDEIRGLKEGTVIYVNDRTMSHKDYRYFEQEAKNRKLIIKEDNNE